MENEIIKKDGKKYKLVPVEESEEQITKEKLIKLLNEGKIKEFNDLVRDDNWDKCPKIFGKLNLSEANLSEADLFKANLSEANLSEANLSEADLSEANLSKADLSEANYWKTNFWKTIFSKSSWEMAKKIMDCVIKN